VLEPAEAPPEPAWPDVPTLARWLPALAPAAPGGALGLGLAGLPRTDVSTSLPGRREAPGGMQPPAADHCPATARLPEALPLPGAPPTALPPTAFPPLA